MKAGEHCYGAFGSKLGGSLLILVLGLNTSTRAQSQPPFAPDFDPQAYGEQQSPFSPQQEQFLRLQQRFLQPQPPQQQSFAPNFFRPRFNLGGFSQPESPFSVNPIGNGQYNPLLNALIASGRGGGAFPPNSRPFSVKILPIPSRSFTPQRSGNNQFPSPSGAAGDDRSLPRPQEGPQTFFGIYGIPSTLKNWVNAPDQTSSFIPQTGIQPPVNNNGAQEQPSIAPTVPEEQPPREQLAGFTDGQPSDPSVQPAITVTKTEVSTSLVTVTKTVTETSTVQTPEQLTEQSTTSSVNTTPNPTETPSNPAVDIQPTATTPTTSGEEAAANSGATEQTSTTESSTSSSADLLTTSTETVESESTTVQATETTASTISENEQSTEASSSTSESGENIPEGFKTNFNGGDTSAENSETTTPVRTGTSEQKPLLSDSDNNSLPNLPPPPSCTPLECKDNPADGNCYAFMKTQHTLLYAERECFKYCATVARATETNRDFLGKFVDEQFPDNKTECYNRITMLANQADVRPKKYGTYAYTMGDHCREASAADGNDAAYDVCAPTFDCTLVDWLRPTYWICARPSLTQQPQPNAPLIDQSSADPNSWCIRALNQMAGENNGTAQPQNSAFEVFVTCSPITEPIVPEFKYNDPLCVPFDMGSNVKDYAQQVMKAFNLGNVRLLTSFILPQIGAFKQCITRNGAECSEAEETDAPVYGLCRIQRDLPPPSKDVARYAQLWADGRVPYSLADFASFPANATAIRNAMDDIATQSMACIKFEEINITASAAAESSDHLDILRNISPNTCSADTMGRAGGPQAIAYGTECFKKVGLLYRILLHSLGIPAEHTRYDRDQHLDVKAELVNPDPSYQKQVNNKQTIPGILSLNTTYDYDSVTHFPREALAAQRGQSVFVPKDSNAKIGQRTHLSEGDKEKLRLLYGKCS